MTNLRPQNPEDRIAAELEAGQKAWSEKNDGKARACARRAAGIIIKEYLILKQPSSSVSQSALDRLREVTVNENLPENIRKAALRLITNVNDRLSVDFTLHPINDAKILIAYFKNLL
jgi:hypothetical protein